MKTFILTIAFCILSATVYAESTHFTWLVDDDAKVRVAYKLETGENISPVPHISVDGKTYSTGSWRVTEEEMNNLKADRAIAEEGDIKSRIGAEPVDFIKKVDVP